MPSQEELWALVASHREGILATIGPSGRPQLSNVLYVAGPGRLVRISTIADRVKAKNLARDPRASLHVPGEDFWHFAVAVGTATLSDARFDGRELEKEPLWLPIKAALGKPRDLSPITPMARHPASSLPDQPPCADAKRAVRERTSTLPTR